MFKLIITELAHEDLRSIVKYIKLILCAPMAASNFTDEVKRCYARLKKNPYLYTLCNDERLVHLGYRKAIIKNYLLVYSIDEPNSIVNVNRFFYGAEEYYNKV